ncbi:MAG: hypothetical protein OHK0013_04050 [Sandaracinaceae bacterium]
MTDRPKIPVVVRRRPVQDGASTKDVPDPSGTRTVPTPARGVARDAVTREGAMRDGPLLTPAQGVSRGRAFHAPNAIPAPRESSPTPSRPIMREAPVTAPNVRTFGSSKVRGGRPAHGIARGRGTPAWGQDRSRRVRAPREIKPPTPPKPRPPMEVFPIDDLTIKVLRAVVESTARNAALPQASTDPDFVPGATYRDIRRVLSLSWPDVRDAVQRARPHQVLAVGRFFGRFGPVFVISEYGKAVLAAADAGQPLPEPPEDIAKSLERARAARAAWDAQMDQVG